MGNGMVIAVSNPISAAHLLRLSEFHFNSTRSTVFEPHAAQITPHMHVKTVRCACEAARA